MSSNEGLGFEFQTSSSKDTSLAENESTNELNELSGVHHFPHCPHTAEGQSENSKISCKKPSHLGGNQRPLVPNATNSKSDAYMDPESDHVEYSVFFKLKDVENYLMEQEIKQTTKFILNRICKGFGTPDPGMRCFPLITQVIITCCSQHSL